MREKERVMLLEEREGDRQAETERVNKREEKRNVGRE